MAWTRSPASSITRPSGSWALRQRSGLSLKLVEEGVLTLHEVNLQAQRQSGISAQDRKGNALAGADADITIIDPDLEWTVDASQFKSKSKNTPFNGWKLKGRAVQTIVGGRV